MYNVFSFKQATIELLKRMALRTLALALMTIVGFYVVEVLVQSGISDKYAIVRRFPEFIPFMLAAAKFTFVEMSLFWIRMSVQPDNDAQNAVRNAMQSSVGAAIVHATNTLAWIFRFVVFLYLVQA